VLLALIPVFAHQPLMLRRVEIFGLLIPWFLFIAYSYVRFNYFHCPRCGKLFESKGNPFLDASRTPRQSCANCGLKRYEDA
jgi:DNA-directed RNA polymerase subunit RPC12/RpoP